MTTIDDCRVIRFPRKQGDRNGNLTVAQDLPFEVKRVYYIYDVPGGESRGEHAHYSLYQTLVAASGSFTVILDDGTRKKTVFLNKPYEGLLLPPGIWHHLIDFASGSVVLSLNSAPYDEEDCMRDFNQFLAYRRSYEADQVSRSSEDN